MIRILRAADHKPMPWKNGGGVTTEIAVWPQDAGLGDFDWRVSMARVETEGPFSSFPGIDRTLAVLDGEGIILKVEGQMALGLLRTSDPVTFPADVPTACNLVKGPISDLNVMVRRGRFVAEVTRVALDDAADFASDAEIVLMFCHSGDARIAVGSGRFVLGPRDCLQADKPAEQFLATPQPACELLVVELRAAST